jgi:hypothetical protein
MPDGSDPSAIFAELGMKAPPMIKPAQVRSQARNLSKSVLTDWSLLSHIVERYGSRIEKRWLKKSPTQRKQLLMSAWGNKIAAEHRPDFELLRTKNEGELQCQALIWPYINQEDLSSKRLMMILLKSRSRNHPGAIVRVDFDATHVGLVACKIERPFLNRHVMVFAGRRTPQTYGELIAWDDHPDALDWMVSNRGHIPGEAFLF